MLTDDEGSSGMRENSRSSELYARACDVLPGGNSRTTVFNAPYPIYAASGQGCRITDVDGNVRLDFLCNHTSLLHGYAEPSITAAIQSQAATGTCFSMPTEYEIDLAGILCERLPTADRAWFVNSGSEAVTLASKLARTHTGRTRIAKCEGAYHGTYDPVYVNVGAAPQAWDAGDPEVVSEVRGMPRQITDASVVVPFNDADGAERILRRYADELAAVFIDPMPNRVGLAPATPEYLARLRDVTRELGVVLVFDEVISFRLGWSGAQGAYGIDPDLTTVAKIIGGGLPIGAVCGRNDIMALLDPRGAGPDLPHGGTFNANPLSLVAGIAAMRLWTPQEVERLNRLGERLRDGVRKAFEAAGIEGSVNGSGSLSYLHFVSGPVTEYRTAYKNDRQRAMLRLVYRHMLDNGVLMGSTGLICLSTAMGESEIDEFLTAFAGGLRRVREVVREDRTRTGTDGRSPYPEDEERW